MHTKHTKRRKWQKIALVGVLVVGMLTSMALPCFATGEEYTSKMLTPDIPLNMTLTYKNGHTFSTSLTDNVDTTATEYPNVVFNDGYNAIKKGINSSANVPDDVYPFNERMQYNGSLYAEDMKEVNKVSFNATSFIISRAKGAYNGVTDTLDQMFEFSMPAYMCADVVISYDIYFGGVDPKGDITKRYVIRNDEGLKITPITFDDIDNVAPNEDWEYAMIHNFVVEIDIIAYTYGVEGASVATYAEVSPVATADNHEAIEIWYGNPNTNEGFIPMKAFSEALGVTALGIYTVDTYPTENIKSYVQGNSESGIEPEMYFYYVKSENDVFVYEGGEWVALNEVFSSDGISLSFKGEITRISRPTEEGYYVEVKTPVGDGAVIVIDGVIKPIAVHMGDLNEQYFVPKCSSYIVDTIPLDDGVHGDISFFYVKDLNEIMLEVETDVWCTFGEFFADGGEIATFGGVITDISEATENDTYYFLCDPSVDYTYPSDTTTPEEPTPEMVDPSFEFLRFTYSAVNPEAYGEPEGLYVGYWNEWIYPLAPENFQEGYEFGYSEGYEKGYKTGYGETSPNITQWLSTAVGGILTFELLPGISFLGILGVIISIALAIALLKFFAGG